MSEIIDRARALRAKIEALATDHIEDEEATGYTELFPSWDENGKAYTTGDRVRYGGTLYKALQSHTSQPMWTKVLAWQEGTEIGEWEQPDSTNPYMKGDRVRFEGKVYESLIDGNVCSPAEYPTEWRIVE